MPTQTEESVVTLKTRELCQSLLNDPEIKSFRGAIDAFMANDNVRGQYDSLMMKGQLLQQKQQSGLNLSDAEINDFEQARDKFVKDPLARGFLDAQEGIQKIQQSVSQYVSKSLELGRVAEESDLDHGGCGHGCGCGHGH